MDQGLPFEDQEPVEQNIQRIRDRKEVMNDCQVETFVEVKIIYHKKFAIVQRTNVDEGTMPKWNEVLEFPLKADDEKGFTKEELLNTEAQIMITLFDRQEYKSSQDGKKITQEENRFLGSITVPLSTVLCNTEKLDYNFKLNRPVALPAYRVLDDEIYFMKPEKLEEEKLRENEQLSTYLNVSISLDPVIELPVQN